MAVRAIRGAVQIDANERAAVLEGTAELVTEVMTRNGLVTDDVISVVFTATPDLTAEFPALAARKIGFQDVPLLCASEIDVPGALPRVVRLLMHVETGKPRVRAAARVPAGRGGPAAGHRPMTPRPGGPETGAPGRLGSAVVIGTGLIGTSIALALSEQGVTVWLTDQEPAAARLAADIGAGKVLPEPLGAAEPGRAAPEVRAELRQPSPGEPERRHWADLAVLAVPPAAVAPSLAAAQARRLARWYTDVASVKALPLRQASELGCDLASFRARPPAVRAGALGPRRRPGRPVPRPPMDDLPRAAEPSRRRSRPSSTWCAAAGASRCRPPRTSTTAGWRWSRTRRMWWPPPWRPS